MVVRIRAGSAVIAVQPPVCISVWGFIGHYPAQQESCLTSRLNVWAQSLSPSTMVR